MTVPSTLTGPALLERLRGDFIGIDTAYPLASGGSAPRHYLDSAASTLLLRPAWRVAEAFARHYANTHSQLHYGARIASDSYAWAHEQVLRFVAADPARYTAMFCGSGATAGFNRLARALAQRRPERDLVLVSDLEHHSNDLPHRKHAGRVLRIPAAGSDRSAGPVDIEALERLLAAHGPRINYLAVTCASNVTGVINPIHRIAALAHAHGAWLVADAAQLLAHVPFSMQPADGDGEAPDFLVFSGHKIYAPGSPGVVVARRDLTASLEPDEVGGGMVDLVWPDHCLVTQALPDREEAGTPPIIGAVLLGAVLELLQRVGMDTVAAKEAALLERLLDGLADIPAVRVYGPDRRVARTATVSFNVDGADHGLVAAVLNDYYNVAVRNECFCAHPYVREMVRQELWALDLDPDDLSQLPRLKAKQGLVRASLGLYTTEADIDALLAGVADIAARPEHYLALYRLQPNGDYFHREHAPQSRTLFDPNSALDTALARRPA